MPRSSSAPDSRSRPVALALAAGALLVVVACAALAPAWVLGLAAAVAAMVLLLRSPPLTVIAFWAVYAAMTTVFATVDTGQGFYYPLYLLMGLNAARAFLRRQGTLTVPWAVMASGLAFYAFVAFGLLWSPWQLSDGSTQRLFIYSLALLAAAQIRTEQQQEFVFRGFALTGLVIALWTDFVADTGTFAHRGDLAVNPNHIAAIVGTTTLLLWARLLGGTARRGRRRDLALLAGIGVCLYANLVLASRGTTLALVAGMGAIAAGLARRALRGAALRALVVGVLLVGLSALPGARNLGARFGEASAGSFNERLPLWEHGLRVFGESSVGDMLLGRGMGASNDIAREVDPALGSLHNDYLQLLVEYGLLGLLGFLALVAACFSSARRQPGARRAVVTGGLVFALTLGLSASTTNNFLFWAFLGALMPSPRARAHGETQVRVRRAVARGEGAT